MFLPSLNWAKPRLTHVHSLSKTKSKRIEAEDRSVDGFNIGMDNGVSAGQTVIIAIYILFLAELVTKMTPRGEVKHILPGKGYY